MKFKEVIQALGEGVLGSYIPQDNEPEITGVAAIMEATSHDLSYIESPKFVSFLKETQASGLILFPDDGLTQQVTEKGLAWLTTKEPRLLFAKAIELFYQPFRPEAQIHPTAIIAPSVQLGEGVYIGPYVVIEEGCKLGDRVCIHGNTMIGPDVEIGDNTVIYGNCTLYERTQIKARCIIHAGVVIGGDGFGYIPTAQGPYKMQQSGYVLLEEGVEVGCNTTIDRPAVGYTHIGKNTKIDNLVQVGHGSTIGENTMIVAQAGMAGKTKVGNNVILAGQVGIANEAEIGDGAIATAKAGIHKNIKAGEIVSGIPAIPYKNWLKISAVYNRLPEIYKFFRQQTK